MKIFDMLLAQAMGEGGGGGGGGSSDFSTATVTCVDGANWIQLYVPSIYNNEVAMPFTSGGSSFTAILYKGVAVMGGNDAIVSVSGNITYDEEEEVYFITGDCTITMAGANIIG